MTETIIIILLLSGFVNSFIKSSIFLGKEAGGIKREDFPFN